VLSLSQLKSCIMHLHMSCRPSLNKLHKECGAAVVSAFFKYRQYLSTLSYTSLTRALICVDPYYLHFPTTHRDSIDCIVRIEFGDVVHCALV
jgi:hypothetical protein